MQDKIYLGQLNNYNLLGEFVLNFEKNTFAKITKKEPVFIEIDNRLVPFFIEELKKRSKNSAIIKFDDIIIEERLEKLIGCKAYSIKAEKIITLSEPESDTNILIGFTLFDSEIGKIGIVKEIITYSYNTILSVYKGRTEILVPYAEEIIKEIDIEKKTILTELPDGLLDLYI